MRLFIAIELPENVRKHLRTVQEKLKPTVHSAISWTRQENLHLTLKFLGDVPDKDVPGVCTAMKDVKAAGGISLHAEDLRMFPPRGPVRIVGAAMVGDLKRLTNLYESIEEVCAKQGFARENREYNAHVTLARPRVPLPEPMRSTLEDQASKSWPGPDFVARGFVLMQSELRQEGSKYTPIARFDLELP